VQPSSQRRRKSASSNIFHNSLETPPVTVSSGGSGENMSARALTKQCVNDKPVDCRRCLIASAGGVQAQQVSQLKLIRPLSES
jgi:hypothetical protein